MVSSKTGLSYVESSGVFGPCLYYDIAFIR